MWFTRTDKKQERERKINVLNSDDATSDRNKHDSFAVEEDLTKHTASACFKNKLVKTMNFIANWFVEIEKLRNRKLRNEEKLHGALTTVWPIYCLNLRINRQLLIFLGSFLCNRLWWWHETTQGFTSHLFWAPCIPLRFTSTQWNLTKLIQLWESSVKSNSHVIPVKNHKQRTWKVVVL